MKHKKETITASLTKQIRLHIITDMLKDRGVYPV